MTLAEPVIFTTRPWLMPMLVVAMLVAMAVQIAAAVTVSRQHGTKATISLAASCPYAPAIMG